MPATKYWSINAIVRAFTGAPVVSTMGITPAPPPGAIYAAPLLAKANWNPFETVMAGVAEFAILPILVEVPSAFSCHTSPPETT